MTSPHTAGRTESPVLDQQRARGVETNGIGKVTTAHLNLTKTMASQIREEWEDQLRHSAMKGRRTYRRASAPLPRFRINGDPRAVS